MDMRRVTDPADPRRCKFSYAHEQCWHEAESGCSYCAAHGGRSKANVEETRLYNLVEVDNRRRLAELSGHEQIKSLREEIGLVRMLIEKHLNAAQGNVELLASCGSLNQLIVTLTKLVKECHALEQSCGELLSKQTVYRLAQTMCEIVMEELQGIEGYEEIIDRIADRLFPAITKTQNNEALMLPSPPARSVANEVQLSEWNDRHSDAAAREE